MRVVKINPAYNDSVECVMDDGVIYSMKRDALESFLKEHPLVADLQSSPWWRKFLSWFRK
jgi:hypothetical protein